MQIARYYATRGAWVAAAQRAEKSIEQYDGAPSTREALQIMIDAYQHLGYTQLADNTQKVYQQNFPEQPLKTGNTGKWWKPWQRG